jgi:HK97 gp10 family phage protein
MASPVMKFSGGPELLAALGQLPAVIGKNAMTGAMKDVVKPMVADMQLSAPKLTGKSATTIHSAVADVEGQGVTVAVGPSRSGFPLQFAEWGTARQPARPFMRPAWDVHGQEILRGLGAAVWVRLAAAAKRLAKKAGA